jgi:Tfp pilus assembly protein PilN
MIKINLSAAKKQVDISNVGGFDFTKLKIKAIFLVIALIYIPDFVFLPMWESEFLAKQGELDQLQSQVNSLKRKVSQSANMERQIRELKVQEENLGKKLTAVKQAISLKRNPASLLLYIAKNMPEDLWIKELALDNETMIVKGEALSYTSVGNFVNNLRSSIFIKDASIKGTTSTVRESDKRRIESFEIHFAVARFE